MVKITWFGHACFALDVDGYVVVLDPHDGVSIGLPRPNVKADLILISHDHFDHNAANVVRKDGSRVISMLRGVADIGPVKVKGIKTYHDKVGGRRRGENTIYIIEAKGLRFAHLGDLGHIPSNDVLKELEGIDVLMIPVGGVYTIGPDEAWSIVERVKPRITIPMHYWIKGLTLPLHTIDDFLSYVKKIKVERIDTNEIIIEKEILPREPKIIILKYT